MKMLVGLGNPGTEYSKNRHNVGFMLAEFIYKKLSQGQSPERLKQEEKFKAAAGKCKFEFNDWIVVEPQTFMNASGEAVSRLANFYNIGPESIFVAHDDLDIPFGKFKIQSGTGPKLHGGLSSIEQLIGTKDFWRIRIGVESRAPDIRMPGEAFVLQNFSADELQNLGLIFNAIYSQLISNKML